MPLPDEAHLDPRDVHIKCGCCQEKFTINLGGSAYCPICRSGECPACNA